MNHDNKLSYTVDQTVDATGLNRSALYRAIATGQIATFKVGKRRMVSARALRAFIEQKEREAVASGVVGV